MLQQALIDLGFYMPHSTGSGTTLPDGIYGDETTRVVLAFQANNGLYRDGVTGPQTLKTLEDHLLRAALIEEGKLRIEMAQPPRYRKWRRT